MNRTVLTMGLLALLGCGAADEAAEVQPDPSATATSDVQVNEEAPRGDLFSTVPARTLAQGTIKPSAWARDDRPGLAPEETRVQGRFDPEAMRAIQQYRLTTKIKEGAQ